MWTAERIAFKIIVTLVILILAVAVVTGYFLLNKVKDDKEPTFENVIRQYFDIREWIGEALAGVVSQKKTNKKDDYHNKGIFAETALAKEKSLNKGAIIARGIAGFLEIGRDKDITNAMIVNSEDITRIYEAKDNLKEISNEAYILQRSRLGQDKDIDNFLESLLGQYKDMDSLLDELLVYKKFNAEQLAAAELEKIEKSIKKQIEIMAGLLVFSKDEERFNYLGAITPKYKKALAEAAVAFRESVENLKKIKISDDARDYDLLRNILQSRIDKYVVAAQVSEKTLADIEEKGSLKNFVLDLFNSFDESDKNVFDSLNQPDSLELREAEIKMKRAIQKYKNDSRLAEIFKKIIITDTKLNEKSAFLKEKFNFSFYIGEGIYLEDLLAQFYRNETTEIQKRLEELEKDAKEKFGGSGRVASVFTVEPRHYSMTVTMLVEGDGAENMVFTLETPAGKIINKDIAQKTEGMRFASSRTYQLFKIENPEPGAWRAIAEGTAGAKVNINVSAKGN